MKLILRFGYVTVLICFCLLIYPGSAFSAVTLPYSTTFNCADWDGKSPWPSCDDIEQGGNFIPIESHLSAINSSGNNAPGGGGKGYRVWAGSGDNQQSDYFYVRWTGVPSIWIRWYQRFPSGFSFSSFNYYKLMYVYDNGFAWDFYGTNNYILDDQTADIGHGWTTIMEEPQEMDYGIIMNCI